MSRVINTSSADSVSTVTQSSLISRKRIPERADQLRFDFDSPRPEDEVLNDFVRKYRESTHSPLSLTTTSSGESIKVSESPQEDWRDIYRHLDEFTRLPENWDTYGGVAPSRRAYARARWMLQEWKFMASRFGETLPKPYIAPCGNGNIQIEWSVGRRSLEVEVSGSENPLEAYCWLTTLEANDTDHYNTGVISEINDNQSRRLILWLLGEK